MLSEKFEKFIVAERRKEMSRFSVKKPYTVFVAGTDVWIENEVYCNCPMPENLKAKRTEYAIEGAESRSCLKDSLAVSKQFPAPSEYLTIVQGE